jgi:hypothetical protein
MIDQARATVLAWRQTMEAAWRHRSDLLSAPGGMLMPADALAAPPPPGARPSENTAYWAELTDEQRLRLVREQPELVGSRDGFPADARDAANRMLLAREKAALETERDQLTQQLSFDPAGNPAVVQRLAEIRQELGGIAVLENRLNAPPDPNNANATRYYLLGFDTNGPGRDATAIVAHGNPDTADNVATYVPGAESSFAQLDRLMNESDAMYRSANRVELNSSVITWLGYDAPDPLAHAAWDNYAIAANQPLDQFQQGLHAVNPGAHHTLVGHSYGSVVVGYAARDGGLEAVVDDIVAIGSPGMGVDTAAELRIPTDQVWVLEANQDMIADLGRIGWYGADPGDADFGAQQLRADPEGRRPTTPGDVGNVLGAHLSYFFSSPAHENIGDVIAGRPPSHR